MEIVNVADLKAHLSDVLAKITKTGEPVVVGRYGKPVAKLVPYSGAANPRTLGFGKHLLFDSVPGLQKQVDAPVDTDILDGFYS